MEFLLSILLIHGAKIQIFFVSLVFSCEKMRLFGEIFKHDWCTAFLARKFLPYQKKKYVMNWAFNVCLFSRPLQRMRWWVGSCRIEWMHLLSISKLEECPLYSRFPSIPYKWAFPTHGFANLVDGTPAGRISWAKKTPHLSLVNIIATFFSIKVFALSRLSIFLPLNCEFYRGVLFNLYIIYRLWDSSDTLSHDAFFPTCKTQCFCGSCFYRNTFLRNTK